MTLPSRCSDLIVLLVFLLFGTSTLQAQTVLPSRFSADVYASDRVFGQTNA